MVEAAAVGDAYDSLSREDIRTQLKAVAEGHVAAAPSYKNIKTDPSRDLNCWLGVESGISLTVLTMKAEGLAISDFLPCVTPEAFPAFMKILDPILTCRKMDDQPSGEGHYIMYQHVKTPMVVSNRCVFNTVYDIEMLENGGYIHLTTSKGNKAIEAANTALIGKDVLSNSFMTYNKVEPIVDGTGVTITSVMCVDPAGALPDFIKAKIATQNSDTTEKMVKHLRKQKGLK